MVCFVLFVCSSYSQAADTAFTSGGMDTTLQETNYPDSNMIQEYLETGNYRNVLLKEDKPIVNDVQQIHSSNKNAIVFIFLMLMLVTLTYVKVVFSKDIEEMLQSFVNSNIAQQIFRTQSSEISFSSFLLHVNFIIAISLYVQFILVNYFHVVSFKSFSSILMLIFLFTFFYVAKVITLKFVGVVFEVNEVCNEYIFNFSTVCKMTGLTLIPALFIFYTTPEKFFNLIFVITIFISTAFAAIFVWRGLSTGYKLLYRSVYHFFIYVCVVEISPIFLLFKLLTKTIQ